MKNIIEGIQEQCPRCRDLVQQYEAIGSVGAFGKAMIEADIREGEAAIASGDTVRMVKALKTLKGCE
jgi:hypothetical protein